MCPYHALPSVSHLVQSPTHHLHDHFPLGMVSVQSLGLPSMTMTMSCILFWHPWPWQRRVPYHYSTNLYHISWCLCNLWHWWTAYLWTVDFHWKQSCLWQVTSIWRNYLILSCWRKSKKFLPENCWHGFEPRFSHSQWWIWCSCLLVQISPSSAQSNGSS